MSDEPVESPPVFRARLTALSLSVLYFGCPVYLVGAGLHDPDPRDVDLVVPIPDALFFAMYADPAVDTIAGWHEGHDTLDPPQIWRRWARDCAKQNAALTRWCRRKVDFKTQPQSLFDSFTQPRRRLDGGITRASADDAATGGATPGG